MPNLTRYSLLVAAILVGGPADAAGDHDSVERRLADYLRKAADEGFTGGVIVAQGDDILLRAGYGQRIPGTNEQVRADTVSTIGSITKQFTGAAVMLLAQQGELSVEDTLAMYFDGVPDDKAAITIHQLLSHQAGLEPAIGPDSERIGRSAWLERAFATDLLFPPGDGYEYSNVGYSIAAAIVEQVSGEGYETFLNKHFFHRLGMRDTGYHLSESAAQRVAHGRTDDGGDWGSVYAKFLDDGGPGWHLVGNGGIHSTPDDMLRWHRALQESGVLEPEYVAKLSGQYAAEPGGTWYGYGWVTEMTPWGATLITHNGGNPWYFADFLRFPDDDIAIFLWTTSREPRFNDLGRSLAAIVYGEPAPDIPPPRAPLVRTGEGPPAAANTAAAEWRLPGTDTGQVAARMIKLLRTADNARRVALGRETLHPALLESRGEDGIADLAAAIREHLGEFRLLGIRPYDGGRVDVEFDTVKGIVALELGLEDADGLKVRAIGLRIGE